MYLLYSLVLSLLFIALLPYFAYQALRRGKYSGSFKERMGFLPALLHGDARETVWVHTVSVGEFLAARSLIGLLRRELPGARIVVSTTTLTGQQLARSQSHLFDDLLYFPFDWKFSVRRALSTVSPRVVILLETELWPNFLRECRKRSVSTVLANGRISPRSFRRYQLVGAPFRRAIEDFSLMVMQSEADADRARRLGAPVDRVRVCGNLKYDQSETRQESRDIAKPSDEIDRLFGLSLSPYLIVAGSTAQGEEEMLLATLAEIRKSAGLEDARLVLAPRRPERFDEVARLIRRSGFVFARRSESGQSPLKIQSPIKSIGKVDAASSTKTPDVILLDTIGELASIYRFAAVVFVGGSLVPRGGHNVIEPAAFAKPIVVGPHTENFRQIVSDFLQAGALVQINHAGKDGIAELARELTRLLLDRESARATGERARDLLFRNRGATGCTVAMIRELVTIQK